MTSTDARSTVNSQGGPTAGGATPAIPPALPAGLTEMLKRRLTGLVSSSGEAHRVTTHAPFAGAAIVDLPQCTPADVDAAAARARAAQREWATVPVRERAAVFLRLHDLVLDARDELMDLIQVENGKARRDAFLEVGDIANTCRYYARIAARALAPHHRTGLIPGLTSVQELHHPKGIVTVISPWNYPLSLGAGDTIPALLAGNAVVQKADNQTALTALFALDLARRAGLPEDLWQIVLGRGSSIGTTLLDAADFVMFTGSTASGRTIAPGGRRAPGRQLHGAGRQERHARARRRRPGPRGRGRRAGLLLLQRPALHLRSSGCTSPMPCTTASCPRSWTRCEAMRMGPGIRLRHPDGLAHLHRAAGGDHRPRRRRAWPPGPPCSPAARPAPTWARSSSSPPSSPTSRRR